MCNLESPIHRTIVGVLCLVSICAKLPCLTNPYLFGLTSCFFHTKRVCNLQLLSFSCFSMHHNVDTLVIVCSYNMVLIDFELAQIFLGTFYKDINELWLFTTVKVLKFFIAILQQLQGYGRYDIHVM